MDYVKLGNTGLDVSRICLGCMSFGDPDTWLHKWALKEEESREIIFFPTCSPRLAKCSWLSLNNIERYYSDGKKVVIEFKNAATSLCDYIVLNGFEIDGKKPVQTISDIYPAANEENHDPLDGLSWTAADVAVSHDVYLGTDE